MNASERGSRENRIERFARGELAPAESRELALDALNEPGLFDDLTAAALAKATLDSAPRAAEVQWRGSRTRVISRSVVAMAAAAAAVIAGISILLLQPAPHYYRTNMLAPVLADSTDPAQPVLLAGVQPVGEDAILFRGEEATSREPRPTGSIVAIDGETASIDLGSLDGVAKGDALGVFHGGSSQSAGRILVTVAFRDRARGRISEGSRIGAGDTVRVNPAAYLNAMLEQARALTARGEWETAARMAETAARSADAATSAPPGLRAAAWNLCAVLRVLRGDRPEAEPQLRAAAETALKDDASYVQSRNNLGVLAEMNGERRTAERLYMEALAASTAPAERLAIQKNLARVKTSR